MNLLIILILLEIIFIPSNVQLYGLFIKIVQSNESQFQKNCLPRKVNGSENHCVVRLIVTDTISAIVVNFTVGKWLVQNNHCVVRFGVTDTITEIVGYFTVGKWLV